MVIVMQEGATEEQIQHVIDRVVASGFDVHRSTGASHTVLGAVGVHRDFDHRDFELLQGVREVVRITQPFKLASRHFKPQGTVIDLGRGVTYAGNPRFWLVTGARLYLFGREQSRDAFAADPARFLKDANARWPGLEQTLAQ